MKDFELIYLSIPYTDISFTVKDLRYAIANRVAAHLMDELLEEDKKIRVFSPISHSHEIAKIGNFDTSWESWKTFDQYMIYCCDRVTVVCIDGWAESVGVREEIEYAESLGKDVEYFFPNQAMQMWP